MVLTLNDCNIFNYTQIDIRVVPWAPAQAFIIPAKTEKKLENLEYPIKFDTIQVSGNILSTNEVITASGNNCYFNFQRVNNVDCYVLSIPDTFAAVFR